MEICLCGIVPWGSQPNFTAIIYASRAATCKKTAKIGHILVSKSNSKDWYKPEAVLVLMVTRGHYGWCHSTEDKISYIFFTQTHIHTRLTALFLGLPRWAGTRKVKTYLDFTEARDSEWQWHQLGLMQVCTLLQTDNHTSSPPLCFIQAGCQPTASKHWRQLYFLQVELYACLASFWSYGVKTKLQKTNIAYCQGWD